MDDEDLKPLTDEQEFLKAWSKYTGEYDVSS